MKSMVLCLEAMELLVAEGAAIRGEAFLEGGKGRFIFFPAAHGVAIYGAHHLVIVRRKDRFFAGGFMER